MSHKLSQAKYFQIFEKESFEEVELTKKKNADYADKSNAFLNFNAIEYLTNGDITTEEGIIVRITDKLQRSINMLKREAKVKDEAVIDTLRDLSVYAKILRIYLMTKTNED